MKYCTKDKMNIGIDLGGSHIGIGLVDNNGKIVSKTDTEIIVDKIEDIENYIIENIVANIYKLLDIKELKLSEVGYIGIGVPGEPSNGVIKRMVNLGIQNFDIVGTLKKKLEYKNIGIRNDGKCAGIAEKMYGSIKEYEDAVFLCIGSGIGGAVFINNKLLNPKRHSGFEIGHMVIKKDGNVCKCGNKGCFETYCSIKYFRNKIISSTDNANITSKNFLEFLSNNKDDESIKILIEEYLEDLIIGLDNIVNIFEPEAITLGGGFSYFREVFFDRLQDKFNNANGLYNKDNIPMLKLAVLGNDAGIIGASIDRLEK